MGTQAARGEREGPGQAAKDSKIQAVRISNVIFNITFNITSNIISNISNAISTFIS